MYKNRYRYVDCLDQLSYVKAGFESYLSENNGLTGIDPYGEVCKHNYSGNEKSKECRSLVEKLMAYSCDNFRVKYVNDGAGALKHYEITGTVKDRKKCGIMITEVRVRPNNYDDCTDEIPRPEH